jgi:hypothetical protein
MVKVIRSKETSETAVVTNSSEINGDNLNNARLEASRHFRNKKREYLKDKINELATNSNNTIVGDIDRETNELRRGYQPRNNLMKDDNGDLLADSNKNLNSGRTTFYSF